MRGKTPLPRLIIFANLVRLTRGRFLCVRRQFFEEVYGENSWISCGFLRDIQGGFREEMEEGVWKFLREFQKFQQSGSFLK